MARASSYMQFGQGQVIAFFILRVFFGIFLVLSGIEKFMNIHGYIKIITGAPIKKFYAAMPAPILPHMSESLIYIILFVQIIIGVFLIIGLFTRLFTFVIFLSISYSLYQALIILVHRHSDIITTNDMWSMAILAVVALTLSISAAGRYIGIDKFIARYQAGRIVS